MDNSRFLQDADTIRVIKNENLVCRNCCYLIKEDTAACEQFDCKPIEVLEGGACEKFAGNREFIET